MDAVHPCEEIQYRLVNKRTGQYFSFGTTNAAGETKPVESMEAGSTCYLEVLDHQANIYVPPDLDGVYGVSERPELILGPANDASSTLKTVKIKPYFRVRFHTQVGAKPIAGAKFKAYQRDANGKEVLARELDRGNPITGVTNARGDTGMIFCAAPLVFKFEIPGSPVSVSTKVLMPLLKGQKVTRYDLPLKTVATTTVPKTQDMLKAMGGVKSMPIIISPQDEELIAVPQSAFDEFEAISGLLEQTMANGHRAKLDLARALEAGDPQEIAAAEKALGLAEDKIKTELNKNFNKLADLKEVVTFESYVKGKDADTGGKQIGLRRRYVSQDKYLQLKNSRLNKADYKLSIKFSQGPATAAAGIAPKNLDVHAFKEAFSRIKTDIKSKHDLGKTDPKVWSLFDEAETQYSDTVVKSESYEVEEHSQWLRFVAGAGASSEIDWKAKKAEIQGNLQAKLVLCEGKRVMRYAYPSLKGWMMRFGGEDLGAIRAVVSCELYGFAGAKLVASGAMGISLAGAKQVVVGIKKDPNIRPLSAQVDAKRRLPVFDPVSPYEKMPDDLNGVKGEINAFAGIEGGVTPGGALQWLPPTEKEFVSFAEASVTVAGTAGAGFNGQLYVFFAQGKFRVRIAAGLCWGIGAKGAMEFTVNAEKIFQFAKWVHYQLLNSGIRNLVFITREAFMSLSQLLLLLTQEGIAVLDGKTVDEVRQSQLYKRIEKSVADVGTQFDAWLLQIDNAKTRNQLVLNINRKPQWLVHATPETRGMLVYQIVLHGVPSHMRDTPSLSFEGINLELHFLPSHKQAVNNIMATVQTAREWVNVMEHMSVDGEKSERPPGKNEGNVLRFLNNGYSLVEDLPSLIKDVNKREEVKQTGNQYLDAYLKMRNEVRNDFPKGYQVVRLDSPHLDLVLPGDGREHPSFASAQTAQLGEAYAGDPGSSIV
jgi:hypothetical protein